MVPGNPAFLDTLGWILFKMGKYKEACKYLKKALSKMKGDPVISEHYGECLYKMGKFKEASKYLKESLEGIKRNPSILEDEKGLDKRAREILKKMGESYE